MTRNFVALQGNLADDPYFQSLTDGQFIAYGQGCDMEQGDQHRTEMAALGGEDAAVAASESVILPDHLLKMLSADAE